MDQQVATLPQAEALHAPSRPRNFELWLQRLEQEVLESLIQVRAWIGVTVIGLIVIAIGGVIPQTRQYFQINPLLAVLLFAPVVVLGVFLALLRGRKLIGLRRFAVGVVVCSGLFQIFLWGLVALSQWPGAAALASFPVFLAAYHGHAFQSAPQSPYVAVGVLVGVVAAFLLNHDGPHISMYLLVGPMAFGTALVLGLNSVRMQVSRRSAAATREAFDAQLLSEQAVRVSHLDEVSKALESSNHDARSALSGALLSLDRLIREGSKVPGSDGRLTDLAIDALQELVQLRAILEAGRESPFNRPHEEKCDLGQALNDLAPKLRERFPDCAIEVAADAECWACLVGGETSAQRILTNLIVNACEGDGRTGAHQVSVHLSNSPHPTLTVTDDGPGLPPSMLQGHIQAFATTKAQGTGLGVYTVDRLVRASGGILEFMRRPDGGSGGHVTVQLRVTT